MAKPVRNSFGPLLLHHSCDRSLAELVLEGKTSPIPSENKYDWIGPGIYFWVDSPSRLTTDGHFGSRQGTAQGLHCQAGVFLDAVEGGSHGDPGLHAGQPCNGWTDQPPGV